MMTAECVTRDQLQEYLSGWAAPEQSDAIEAHLRECSACEHAVAELERDSDTFLEIVRRSQIQSQEPDAPSAVADIAAALDRAKHLTDPIEATDPVRESEWPLAPGDIGSYELLRPIGHGGMGSVYLARHRQLGKQLAIKLLSPKLNRNGGYTARFQREMRAAGGLDHPAIVRATDAGEHDGTHYLAMEYIAGLDLSRIARLLGKLSVADACEIARQVALGLSHAHASGVTHRDIKPSNIMLSAAGQVKILDFGLARLNLWDEASAELTTVGQLIGTLDYMAPEQADRPDSVDYRADLYALGATLFRLLCGRPPLAASPEMSPLAKLRLLATHQPPSLATLRPDAPEGLVRLVASLLAREPESRPASAAHVAEELQTFAQGADLPALVARSEARAQESSDEKLPTAHNSLFRNTLPVDADTGTLAVGAAQPPRRRRRRVIAWAFAPLALLAGILITLETQKGSLVIESEAANVSVKLLRDGKPYEQLKIEPGTSSTRLYAGQYEVTIEGGSDSLLVEGPHVEIRRGEIAIARIRQQPGPIAAREPSNEPLYSGKPLSYWIDTIGREKSTEGYKEALAAVSAMLTSDNGQRITQTLLPMLRSQPAKRLVNNDINLEINTFSILRAANPGTAYYELLAKELESGPHDWHTRILSSLRYMAKDDIPTTAPLTRWLEKNVFSRGGRAEYLTQSADYFQALIGMSHPANDQANKHLAEVLLNCEALDDAYWLSKPTVDGSQPTSDPQFSNAPADRRPYKSWYPLIAERIEQVAVATLANGKADRNLLAQAIIIARVLNSSRYDRSGMHERREELVEAIRSALTSWQSESARMYEEARLPPSFANYVWVPDRYTILSPHLNEPGKSVAVLRNVQQMQQPLQQNDLAVFNAVELLRLVSEVREGAALLNELMWVFNATDAHNAELYGQVDPSRQLALQLAWPQMQPPWQLNEDHTSSSRDQWLASFLHEFSFQLLPEQTQSELRAAVARKYQASVFDARLKEHDRNGDGQLSVEEAEGMMRDPQRIDANGDQQLSRDEFVEYQIKREAVPLAPELAGLVDWAKKTIEKYDQNKDGQLSRDEWSRMVIKPDAADTNGDGIVTLEEYVRFRQSGNRPAQTPSASSAVPNSDAPAANKPAAQTDEPLFKGRPLSSWLDTIGREKSLEGYQESLAAIGALGSHENADRITTVLLQSLRGSPFTGSDELNRTAFTILRARNPGQAFYELIVKELEDSPQAWQARMLDSLTLLQADDAQTIAPLTQWLEKNVFAEGGRSELLRESKEYYFYLIHRSSKISEDAKKHFAEVLINCQTLDEAQWLSRPAYDSLRPSSSSPAYSSGARGRLKAWYPAIGDHIEQVAIRALRNDQADRKLVAQALIILRTLNSKGYDRSGLHDHRDDMVNALRAIMKRWQSKPVELFELQEVDSNFEKYSFFPKQLLVYSPSLKDTRAQVLFPNGNSHAINPSIELLSLIDELKAGPEVNAELVWVFDTTSDRHAKVYQSNDSGNRDVVQWPELDVRQSTPTYATEKRPALTREDRLAAILHSTAFKQLSTETQDQLRAAAYRKELVINVAKQIAEHDTDGDGMLSFEEAKTTALDPQKIDTNGDQRLSVEELTEYLTPQAAPPR